MSKSGKRLSTEEKQRRKEIRQKRLSKHNKLVRYHATIPPGYNEIDNTIREYITTEIKAKLPSLNRYYNVTTYPTMYYRYTTISVVMAIGYNHYISCHVDEPFYFKDGNIRVTMGVRSDTIPTNSSRHNNHSSKYEEFTAALADPAFFEELDAFLERNWQLFLKNINV